MEGFERVRLGDIVKPLSMKHRSTTEGNNSGRYPLISSALNVEYFMDTFDSETPSLIFNTINADGNCSVHYHEKFNTTSNTYVLTCAQMLREHGVPIQQYVLNGLLACENHSGQK